MTSEHKSRGDSFLLSMAPEEMSQPPSLEELLALHRGELSEEEEQRIRRTLVYHPDSREVLAALKQGPLEDLKETGEYLPPDLAAADLDAVFQAVSEEDLRGPRSEKEVDPTPPVQQIPRPARNFLLRNLLPLAAMLLFGTVLGVVVGPMFQSPDAPPRLSPTETKSLQPDGPRGEGQQDTGIPMPQSDSLRVELQVFEAPPYSSYRVDLVRGVDTKAVKILEQGGLQRSSDDTLALDLERGSLPSGIYQFRLYGLENHSEVRLATYTVEF